jgi:hypothetical protein
VSAFLANVGVNSSHSARSPLFPDGTFRLVPIPERDPWQRPMVRFGDLVDLAGHAPARWIQRAAHQDPDLCTVTPTYGDNCRRAGRAFSLRRASAGDIIVFIARLQPADRPAAFHLVGSLVVEDVLADATADPGSGWWDDNAHVRRGRASGSWDSFWVFKGSPASQLFTRARAFGRCEAEAVFGRRWRWRRNRSELQTIGSYTRAVRRVEGQGEAWLRATCQY